MPDQSVQPLPEVENPPVCWVRIDGRDFALNEAEAWKIAWTLIGFCVDRRQAQQQEADVPSAP